MDAEERKLVCFGGHDHWEASHDPMDDSSPPLNGFSRLFKKKKKREDMKFGGGSVGEDPREL